MPVVTIQMLEGRDKQKKRELVEAITTAVVEVCEVKPEETTVIIEEYSRDNWARTGTLVSDR